eukprot:6180864-Prymnesium_polylepis.1
MLWHALFPIRYQASCYITGFFGKCIGTTHRSLGPGAAGPSVQWGPVQRVVAGVRDRPRQRRDGVTGDQLPHAARL